MKKDHQEDSEMKEEKVAQEEVQDKTTELEEKLKQTESEALDFKNRYLRALADYKNLEHRLTQERERIRNSVEKKCIEEFLPVLDHMEQAEPFVKDPGLTMVMSSFKQAFKDLGVTEIDLMGQEFDPYTAEVVEVVPGDEDNKVVEVLAKAYSLRGEVVRHGRVKVSKVSK
jgi:molecular chaperone GrpE